MEREVLQRDFLRFVQEGQDGSESSFVNDASNVVEYSIVRPRPATAAARAAATA